MNVSDERSVVAAGYHKGHIALLAVLLEAQRQSRL